MQTKKIYSTKKKLKISSYFNFFTVKNLSSSFLLPKKNLYFCLKIHLILITKVPKMTGYIKFTKTLCFEFIYFMKLTKNLTILFLLIGKKRNVYTENYYYICHMEVYKNKNAKTSVY